MSPNDESSPASPDPPAHMLGYAAPAAADRRRVGYGAGIGLLAAVVLVPACAFIGAVWDERANRGEHLAGLAGLLIGGMVGFGLVLFGSGAAIWIGRRQHRPLLTGVGLGMGIVLLVALLGFGVCAVAA